MNKLATIDNNILFYFQILPQSYFIVGLGVKIFIDGLFYKYILNYHNYDSHSQNITQSSFYFFFFFPAGGFDAFGLVAVVPFWV